MTSKQTAIDNILTNTQASLDNGLDMFVDADKLEIIYTWLRDYKSRLITRLELLPDMLTQDMLELVNDIATDELY